MKLSKEELKKKIDEVIEDEDIKIGLLEDIEDSVDVSEDTEKVDKIAYDEVVTKYEELKRKYKERFLKGDEKEEDAEEDKKEEIDEELEEEKIVDIKEI